METYGRGPGVGKIGPPAQPLPVAKGMVQVGSRLKFGIESDRIKSRSSCEQNPKIVPHGLMTERTPRQDGKNPNCKSDAPTANERTVARQNFGNRNIVFMTPNFTPSGTDRACRLLSGAIGKKRAL